MIEYVTMGQVESIIENYYKEHHSVLSFYAHWFILSSMEKHLFKFLLFQIFQNGI